MRLNRSLIGIPFALAILLAARPAVWAMDLGEAPSSAVGDLVDSALRDLQVGSTRDAIEKALRAAQMQRDWFAPHAVLAVAYQTADRETDAMAEYRLTQEASFPCSSPDCGEPGKSDRKCLVEAESRLCWLVNRERGAAKLNLLCPIPKLSIVARDHSDEMRDLSYFSHESPVAGHTTVVDRFFEVFHQKPRLIAENLARRWGGDWCFTLAAMDGSHAGLMASPGHHRNIMYPITTTMGIGVAVDQSGAYWITEVFAVSTTADRRKT
jgi:uncharacterized protein YkwD